MLKTTGMLNDELMEYSNPGAAIRRMMDNKRLFKVRHGLYETNANIPGICLAIHIYGPSYLSFDFALSYYDLIPEAVTLSDAFSGLFHPDRTITTARDDANNRRVHDW